MRSPKYGRDAREYWRENGKEGVRIAERAVMDGRRSEGGSRKVWSN